VTQAFVREETNAQVFHELCMRHRANHLREARAHGVYVPTLDLAGQVFIVIALLLGGWRVEQGAMTVGTLIGVMLMTRPFFQPITVLGEMYNLTLMAMAGGERLFHLLDTTPSIREPESPVELPRTKLGAKVEFDRVSFEYVPGTPVLHEITFNAQSQIKAVLIKDQPFGPFVPQDDFNGILTDITYTISLDAGLVTGGSFAVDVDGGEGLDFLDAVEDEDAGGLFVRAHGPMISRFAGVAQTFPARKGSGTGLGMPEYDRNRRAGPDPRLRLSGRAAGASGAGPPAPGAPRPASRSWRRAGASRAGSPTSG